MMLELINSHVSLVERLKLPAFQPQAALSIGKGAKKYERRNGVEKSAESDGKILEIDFVYGHVPNWRFGVPLSLSE